MNNNYVMWRSLSRLNLLAMCQSEGKLTLFMNILQLGTPRWLSSNVCINISS